MKKVLIAFLLLAVCFGSVFAQVNVTGNFDYRAGFGDGYNNGGFNKIRLGFNANVGDYNTVDLKLFFERMTILNPAAVVASYTVTTEWGALFGLPVDITTVIGGHNGASSASVFGIGDDYYVSDIYWENLGGIYLDAGTAVKLSVGIMDMVTLDVATNFNVPNFQLYAGATVDFSPIALKVGYLSYKEPDLLASTPFAGYADGIIYGELKFAMDVADDMNLTVVGGVSYDLDSDATTNLAYSGGLSFAAFGAKLAVVASGDDDAFQNLGVQANYMITDALKLDVALGLNMNTAGNEETLMGVGGGIVYNVGGANFGVGYIYSPEDGKSFNFRGSSTADNGGMYVRVNFTF